MIVNVILGVLAVASAAITVFAAFKIAKLVREELNEARAIAKQSKAKADAVLLLFDG